MAEKAIHVSPSIGNTWWRTPKVEGAGSNSVKCGFESHRHYLSTLKIGSKLSNKTVKPRWEMDYSELYEEWASRYDFGGKGEMTLQEAKAFHQKWKQLGTEARLGTL